VTEPMSENDITDAWITSSAAILKLPIESAWLPAIRANVEVTFRLAKLVDEFPLPDEAEPAPVYEA
jgi:lipopolysaccharide biosynthesis protein